MVRVDFSNPFVAGHFPVWLQSHQKHLKQVQASLGKWAAASRQKEAAQSASGTTRRPPRDLAVVFDIDEIILCNIRAASAESGFSVESHFPPPETLPDGCNLGPPTSLKSWPKDPVWLHLTASRTGFNPMYPGAGELLAECCSLGLTVYLVTGRNEALRAETITNFEILGLLGHHTGLDRANLSADGDRLHMVPPEMTKHGTTPPMRPYKEAVRAKISERHRLVANIGDQISDLGYHGDVQCLIPHAYYTTH